MRATLEKIREAKRNGDELALNDAFVELGTRARILFQRRVAWDLASVVDEYSIPIEDVEDVLSDALYRVFERIESFRGDSDAAAEAWVRKIVERRKLDVLRKYVRRSKIWRRVFSAAPKKGRAALETGASRDERR